MDTLLSVVTRHPVWVLLGVAGITLLSAAQIVDFRSGRVRLVIDPSVDNMLPADDEARVYYDEIRTLFGSDEAVAVVLVHDDILSAPYLRRVVAMTRRIEAVQGVHHVVSLASAIQVRSEDGDLTIAPFLEEVPETPEAIAALRRAILEDPIYAGSLVSEDGTATALMVHLRDMPERELVGSGIDLEIARIANGEAGDAAVSLAGGLFMKAEHSRRLIEDLSRTVPLAILVSFVVALLSFRSLRGVLIPGVTTVVALVWTLGAIAAVGGSLNLVTVIMPTILLVVGLAYAVHVMSEYYDVLREPEPGPDPVHTALRRVWLPVALTGATTAVGFLSLATSSIGAVKEFGVWSALGVLATVAVSLTLAPAVLELLPRRAVPRSAAGGLFDRAAAALAGFDVRNRVPILVAGGAIFAIALAGATQLEVRTHFANRGSAAERGLEVVNRYFGGANRFYVVVAAQETGAFKRPANLQALRDFQDWLATQPDVGGSTSLADFVELIYQAFREEPDAPPTLPDSSGLVSQLLFFAGGDEIERFADSRYRTASIHVRTALNDSASMEDLLRRIEERLAGLPEGLTGRVTGNSVLVTRTVDDIARGQASSLTVAFAAIFAVLALLFTSTRVGFLALIPNALPVAVYFGILGFSGITLNSTTGLVACLVLGIAVDDTIHFLARFNVEAKRAADEVRGVAEALRVVARPVTYTTLALCAGFLALTTSSFRNQVEFGALAAITLATAWLVDVTFTPALASRMQIVSLWDALTLDLGDDPERSIPLFAGLRKTQARIAALVATISRFPAGHRLFSAGDLGDEMYVVIEGRLSVELGTGAGRVHLNSLERGDVVGEVALLHGVRTADVIAETDVRLLELTHTSLDRLRKRYPRTGAQLYANLSKILADRVASTAERLR